MVGFKRAKSLQDLLVRAKLPEIGTKSGKCKGCGGKRCDVCNYLREGNEFSNKAGKSYQLRTGDLNCNSKYVVYLVEYSTCGIQYVGSTSTKFRLRFNNYKSCYRRYSSGNQVPQASFHAHFAQEGHQGMADWNILLIDQVDCLENLRRREFFWQNTLGTFIPNGLNERDVTLDVG